ncbi:MAG TPA: thioredoxin family protein, partial [Kofleriaceae bacterium]|nr:thioredoxin family protein [Kofleriaceae bacterium]
MVRPWVLAVLIACKNDPAPPKAQPVAPAVPDPCAKTKPVGQMQWIDDDYAAAVACAKQQKKPIVVDLWAPWCHTCLSMQTTVFTDASFAGERDKFVWLAMDTDRPENAAPLQKLAISAWPTFYVLGADESVLARFVGAASVPQFHDFLAAGVKAQAGGGAAADARMLGAERALALKDYDAADSELAAALTAAPKDWARRPELLNTMILTKYKKRDSAGCIAIADEHMDETGHAAAASDFLVTAMSCAEDRAKDEPDRVKALREQAALARAVHHRQRLVGPLRGLRQLPRLEVDPAEARGRVVFGRQILRALLERGHEVERLAEVDVDLGARPVVGPRGERVGRLRGGVVEQRAL